MTSIFISYRRQDASGHAGRLSDRLVARFGADHVFMDVEDIQPGQNFARSIEQTLAQCSHVLAVVGPRWIESLQARSAAGEDFVRHEIAMALTRGLTVIPVLVAGARMPAPSDLPAELSAFRPAHDRRSRVQNPESHRTRADPPRDLRDAAHPGGGSDTGQDLAPPRRVVTTKTLTY